MFLHIGGSRTVAVKDIVGIFDIRIKEKQCNKEFLQATREIKIAEDEEEVKSFIVVNNGVSYSPIAPGTLKKRFQENIFDK